MKRLHVHYRIMKSHDTCISRNFLVHTVASLERLKKEALIPAPADYEVGSLIKFLKNKRRGMLSADVVLLHDNSRPHTVRRSTYLQEFGWEVFIHPPYSPDLAPSNFHPFLHLKKLLSSQLQRLQNDRRTEMSVTQWFQSQAADFYDTRTQKLVPRFHKCLISGGEYVEN